MPILLALSICCFAAAAVIRCTDPVVPDIARSFMAAPETVALIASAFAFPYAFSQPLLGPLGDAIGKARIVKGCLATLAVAMTFAALAPSVETLFIARICAGLAAGGTVPVSIAMVGDRVAVSERQVALSRLLMAMLGGQFAGAAGAGAIGQAFGWRAVMWTGAGLSATAALLALMTLAASPNAERARFSLNSIREGYAKVFENPRARICYGAVFVGGICLFGLLPHLASLLEARGAGSVREAGFVISAFAIGGVAYALAVRRILSSLGGQMNMIRAGGIIAAAGFAIAALSFSWPQMASAGFVLGIGFYMIHNSLQTQATELAPTARGAAVSLHAFNFFLGQASGPPLFGLGFTHLGATLTLYLAGAIMAVLGLALASLLQRTA